MENKIFLPTIVENLININFKIMEIFYILFESQNYHFTPITKQCILLQNK